MPDGFHRRPTFLLIGAEKGGSTAIHRYLSQHPDVFLPKRHGLSCFAHGDMDLSDRGVDRVRPLRLAAGYSIPFAVRIGVIMRFRFSPRIFWRSDSEISAPSTLPNCVAKLRPPASLP